VASVGLSALSVKATSSGKLPLTLRAPGAPAR